MKRALPVLRLSRPRRILSDLLGHLKPNPEVACCGPRVCMKKQEVEVAHASSLRHTRWCLTESRVGPAIAWSAKRCNRARATLG